MKRLPTPDTVRFQTSQRGVKFASLADAKKDFEAWLDTGVSPAGAKTSVHIWQNNHERKVEKIGRDDRGETLRSVIRRALQNGTLQIRESGKSRPIRS